MQSPKIIIYSEPDSYEKIFLLRQCTTYILKKLLPIKYKKLTIHLYLNENLASGNEAETCWLDTNILPNEFEIKISKGIKNMRRIIQTLVHELIHVKQFAKGELYDHAYKNSVRWKKTTYRLDNIDYWDYPWEIEAYGKELGLYVSFLHEYKLSNNDLSKNHKIAVEKISCKLPPVVIHKTQEDTGDSSNDVVGRNGAGSDAEARTGSC